MSLNSLLGVVRIVSSPLAMTYRQWHEVRPWPIRKRRRGYRVVRCEESKPGAYQLGDGTMVLHPTLYAQLVKEAA